LVNSRYCPFHNPTKRRKQRQILRTKNLGQKGKLDRMSLEVAESERANKAEHEPHPNSMLGAERETRPRRTPAFRWKSKKRVMEEKMNRNSCSSPGRDGETLRLDPNDSFGGCRRGGGKSRVCPEQKKNNTSKREEGRSQEKTGNRPVTAEYCGV